MRWIEHSRQVLNHPTPTTLFDFENELKREELDVTNDTIIRSEVSKAVDSLKNNKSTILDEVSAELLKHDKNGVIES